MSVQRLDLVQGSDEWLAERLNNLGASEAPAMMGDSKFMSRNQLLDLKKGWQSNPDSSFKKRLFEKGHEHEASAREITEIEECDDLEQAVLLREIDGLKLLASYDGYSEVLIWEHKDWNITLAENVRNGVLEPTHYWQLEHQALVADRDEVMFTCSDGTSENRVSMVYKSDPERRKKLIAGWKQFLADLETHELKAKQEKAVAVQKELPVIRFEVKGTEINSNIGECLEQIKQLAEDEMNKVLETDLDFATKDKLNKDVKKCREKLKETVSKVRGEFVSYAEFEEIAQDMDGVLQKMQSHGEKQVTKAKEDKKNAIKDEAEKNLWNFVEQCNQKLHPMVLGNIMGSVNPDWQGAMKNKRTIESLQNSVDEELAKWKTEINQVMERALPNLEYLREQAADYRFLFNDATQLVNQEEEPFKAVVNARISEHKKAEEERLEAERKRIREEEALRLQREAEEKERAEQEAEEEPAKQEADTTKEPEPEADNVGGEKGKTVVQRVMRSEQTTEAEFATLTCQIPADVYEAARQMLEVKFSAKF